MAPLNPMQLILMLKSRSPQQVAEQVIQQNYPNDPQMQNLLSMARSGNVSGLQSIAQGMLGAQGKNLQNEMTNLMSMIRNL